MYKKIIVSLALDHGISEQALAVARLMKDEDGQILALHVYETPGGTVSAYLNEEDLAKGLATARERLNERIAGLDDVEAVLLRGHSGRAITDYAGQIGADCIVVGSHKPGLSDYFLGSTASRVARHAPCSVHVLR